MAPLESPVFNSRGSGPETVFLEHKFASDDITSGSEMIPCTVASTFPFMPYFGDQISSSISIRLEIANNEGADVDLVLVSIASA